MMGKEKCRILKEIRQRIADENDIPWVTQECTHKGSCRGTCPKCESELRELERQLAARQALGKRVAVAALCAGMAFSAAGCGPLDGPGPTAGEPEPLPTHHTPAPAATPDPDEWVLEGEVPYNELEGYLPYTEPPEVVEGETELLGDVAYIEPAETEGSETAGEPLPEGEVDG